VSHRHGRHSLARKRFAEHQRGPAGRPPAQPSGATDFGPR